VPAPEFAPPIRYDLWGRDIEKPGRTYITRLASPILTTNEAGDAFKGDVAIMRYNDRVASGELGDARPYYPESPDYYYIRAKKQHFFTDSQYSAVQRIAGQIAKRNVSSLAINWNNPDAEDIDKIKAAISSARSQAVNTVKMKKDWE